VPLSCGLTPSTCELFFLDSCARAAPSWAEAHEAKMKLPRRCAQGFCEKGAKWEAVPISFSGRPWAMPAGLGEAGYLLTQVELADDLAVALDVGDLEVIEQAPALADQLEKPAT